MKQHHRQRGGRVLAFALILLLLSGCAVPEAAPAAAPTVTASPQAAAAVTAMPSPEATTQPSPIETTPPDATPSATPDATPSAAPSHAIQGQLVCTAGDSANIRSEASKSGDIVGTLPGGATADVIAYQDGWAQIIYEGITGYVSRDYTVASRRPESDVPKGDWAMILVSPARYLPEEFSVELADFEGGRIDKRILGICEEMFADARKDGFSLKLVDAYRSYERQNELYEAKVKSYTDKGMSRKEAEAEAAAITARPNTSEHQTGLALDIVTPSYTKRNKGFANTAAFKWLDANAQHYGFTLRYKKDKASLTGVIYEPWHWRFVGVEAAMAMKKSGACLEEYLDQTP